MALKWHDTDPAASVAHGKRYRFIAWADGALSGHGRTDYYSNQRAAKAAAEHIDTTEAD